jgi:hypothetical protein
VPVLDEIQVPAELARFRQGDWYDPAERVPPERVEWEPLMWRQVSAHQRWTAARTVWAGAHGFDVDCPHGAAPGQDWWAFLALCAGRDRFWRPGSLDELNEDYAAV